jgi:predicted AlkP superfamily pyrophosphatase or phosphodiesterase
MLVCALFCAPLRLAASAYDNKPKLVVVIVVDQFRGDYLERFRDRLGPNGFRLFTDKGAYFDDCHYDYANLRTAPGHSTLGTGAYTNGHGIPGNEWYSYAYNRVLSSVDDPVFATLKGAGQTGEGFSPNNLQATTFGDELKFATQGKSHVFGIALKDRAAILPAGHAADAAYFIDHEDGEWISSSFYMQALPQWVQQYNASKPQQKYLNQQIKDANGVVTRTTQVKTKSDGTPIGFYDAVGITPFGNDYEFDFARALIEHENLGKHETTDLLVLSLSAFDILGHKVGPDSPEQLQMLLTLDKQLADFFGYLDKQVGLANTWLALSADHGIAPLPDTAAANRFPVLISEDEQNARMINMRLNQQLHPKKADAAAGKQEDVAFVSLVRWPTVFLDSRKFADFGIDEQNAEAMTAAIFQEVSRVPEVYTRWDLQHGIAPNTEMGRRIAHTYSNIAGWEVIGLQPLFSMEAAGGTTHGAPYSYDTHVPLAFYGSVFKPGIYRTHAEPVDLAPTLTNLLGTDRPSHSVGRILTEAIKEASAQSESNRDQR